jgi:hypothetical protein
MRRWWLALGLAIAALFAAWWWRSAGRRSSSPALPAEPQTRSRGVDAGRFRAALAEQLARARELAATRKAMAHPGSGATRQSNIGHELSSPCDLGPAEMCDALLELIDGCDEGDARDCLAAAQYATTTPPRQLVGIVFFVRACRLGDAEACKRADELRHPPSAQTAPCDTDVYLCAWRAYRAEDPVELDQACSLGVADACLFMVRHTDNPQLARAYVETACQLGAAEICGILAMRLQPDCDPEKAEGCYPPDAAQAREALAIACAAGWNRGDCSQLK